MFHTDEASFTALLAVGGAGKIRAGEKEVAFQKGDCFFVPAGKAVVQIFGKSEFLLTRV